MESILKMNPVVGNGRQKQVVRVKRRWRSGFFTLPIESKPHWNPQTFGTGQGSANNIPVNNAKSQQSIVLLEGTKSSDSNKVRLFRKLRCFKEGEKYRKSFKSWQIGFPDIIQVL